ncbi:hypothetical protein BJV82DRAFT_363147 [Fennellomyces sp. T-0311]|nr:hypothetical protein BJV82DRAFT_363147 [Fennellomyces sp. T-0311]
MITRCHLIIFLFWLLLLLLLFRCWATFLCISAWLFAKQEKQTFCQPCLLIMRVFAVASPAPARTFGESFIIVSF